MAANGGIRRPERVPGDSLPPSESHPRIPRGHLGVVKQYRRIRPNHSTEKTGRPAGRCPPRRAAASRHEWPGTHRRPAMAALIRHTAIAQSRNDAGVPHG